MSNKIRKVIGKTCPDCEEGKLKESNGVIICSKCEYIQEDDAKVELDIREQRRLKDEESKVRQEPRRPRSSNTKRI